MVLTFSIFLLFLFFAFLITHIIGTILEVKRINEIVSRLEWAKVNDEEVLIPINYYTEFKANPYKFIKKYAWDMERILVFKDHRKMKS